MPKIKTCSGVKKRFRLTGTGKLKRTRAFMSHNMGKRSQKRVRQGREEALVDQTNRESIMRLLGK